MDFQVFVNTFTSACAVLAVKKGVAGHASEVRIHRANDCYKGTMGVARYRDDMLYSDMVPKDSKFEDFCYRCAFQKQKLHTYVETRYMNCWSDITFLPLEGGDDEISYCAFFFEFTKKPDANRMSTISADIASTVIKNCVILRSATDFYSSLSLVMEDLMIKSDAVATCILQVDRKNRDYEVLCEKFLSKEVSMKEHKHLLPYEVVETWDKTIGGSDGIIIKDKHDLQTLEKINPLWAENLKQTLVTSLILFPLMQGKNAMGYLFITNFDTQKLVQIKELAALTAFFLTSEISEHILVEKLEKLGHEDLLTGVKNRNSMNYRVDMFVSGEQKNCSSVRCYLCRLKRAQTNERQKRSCSWRRAYQISSGLYQIYFYRRRNISCRRRRIRNNLPGLLKRRVRRKGRKTQVQKLLWLTSQPCGWLRLERRWR